jgi:hypothetical protein
MVARWRRRGGARWLLMRDVGTKIWFGQMKILLGDSKLWQSFAKAILGQKPRFALIELGSSYFFLQSGRIFYHCGAVTS